MGQPRWRLLWGIAWGLYACLTLALTAVLYGVHGTEWFATLLLVSINFIILSTTQGPSAAKSITPVLLPIVLIVLKSVSDLPTHPFGTGGVAQTISFIGQPIVALLLGVFLAFLLPKKITREMLSTSGWVGESVVAASIIIVITGCGGSMVVSHANDSYFWVVTGFSKMTVKQGYQLQTVGTFVQGCVTLAALWGISRIVL